MESFEKLANATADTANELVTRKGPNNYQLVTQGQIYIEPLIFNMGKKV